MIKEGCIIVLAVCCIFSVIPLVTVFFNPLSVILPACFLIVVLVYAAYDVKELHVKGKYNLSKYFIISLIAALALSMTAVYVILPYALPKLIA